MLLYNVAHFFPTIVFSYETFIRALNLVITKKEYITIGSPGYIFLLSIGHNAHNRFRHRYFSRSRVKALGLIH